MRVYKGGRMNNFVEKVQELCEAHEKVCMFVDMDGTIVEYTVFESEAEFLKNIEIFETARPLMTVIDKLKQLTAIPNLTLYILTLAKNKAIVEKKKVWLNKYAPFFDKDKIIILDKESGGYTHFNKIFVKTSKISQVMEDTGCDFAMFLDDNQRLLREAKRQLLDKIQTFHISTTID